MKSLIAILGLVLSLAVQADVSTDRNVDHRRNASGRADDGLRDLYDSLSDLSLEDQRQQMWGMASTTKAALWTYNIQRYLRDHPEMSVPAQEVLRDGIRLVTTPAWFDMAPGAFGYEVQSRALEEFKRRMASELSREVIFEVFLRLGPEPYSGSPEPQDDSARRLVPRSEVYTTCSCAGQWECGYFSDFECAPSWCDPARHCGVFGTELCWGNCKRAI